MPKGHVKGFANVPDVMLPPNKDGKLDVGGAIDLGIMRVIKDMGLKEPYVGTVPLQTGEIAEDRLIISRPVNRCRLQLDLAF